MKITGISIVFLFLIVFNCSNAAASTALYQWGFNVNGTFYTNNPHGNHNGNSLHDIPGLVHNNFNEATGTGRMSWRYTAGDIRENMLFIAWFDHDLDEESNGFCNEYGYAHNNPVQGQSWEIDEPGYVFGSIYQNVISGSLGMDNAIPEGSDPTSDGRPGDDVSMATGWHFSLNPGDSAEINLLLTEDADVPVPDLFYLAQIDAESGAEIYFQGDIVITPHIQPVPVPGALLLLGSGLAALLIARNFRVRLSTCHFS